MSIALDSQASSAYTGSGVSTNTATLSTAGTNRVVVAYVTAMKVTTGTPTITSVSGASLTWAKRSGQSFVNSDGGGTTMEVWWAWAASQLTTQVITVTAGATYDHVEISCETYSGIPSTLSTNPWDQNVNLPAYLKYESNTNRLVETSGNHPTITTTNSNDMLLGVIVTSANPTYRGNVPGGWTEVTQKRNAAGTNWDHVVSANFLKTAPVTAYDVGALRDNGNRHGLISDALTADVTANTKRSFTPYTGA